MPSKGGRWNCGLTQEGLRRKVPGEREGQIGNSGFFGLFVSGQVHMRRIAGWFDLAQLQARAA